MRMSSMPSFIFKACLVAIPLLIRSTLAVTSSYYALDSDFGGPTFFSGFNFDTTHDMNNAYVTYVNQTTANHTGLVSFESGGAAYIGVDYKTVLQTAAVGRNSVRLVSKKSWTHGLFIADIAHMPGGICGTWPALWTVGPDWPNNGEIDIIEGVNSQDENLMSLHTNPNCTVAGTSELGTLQEDVCDTTVNYGSGCGVSASATSSYGKGFNSIGGGVYATQWTSDYIRVWFFPRGAIPMNIAHGVPDPSTWGLPQANFQGGCNIDSFFSEHQIVFDNTFCGNWAGNVWTTDPVCGELSFSTCEYYVAENPGAFQNAYWSVNSVKVYTLEPLPLTTTTTSTRPKTKSTTTSTNKYTTSITESTSTSTTKSSTTSTTKSTTTSTSTSSTTTLTKTSSLTTTSSSSSSSPVYKRSRSRSASFNTSQTSTSAKPSQSTSQTTGVSSMSVRSVSIQRGPTLILSASKRSTSSSKSLSTSTQTRQATPSLNAASSLDQQLNPTTTSITVSSSTLVQIFSTWVSQLKPSSWFSIANTIVSSSRSTILPLPLSASQQLRDSGQVPISDLPTAATRTMPRSTTKSSTKTSSTTSMTMTTTTTAALKIPPVMDKRPKYPDDGLSSVEAIQSFTNIGCLSSITDWPTFVLLNSSESMTVQSCLGICTGYAYAGLYEQGCFCGMSLAGTTAEDTGCNIPCPGDGSQTCGGARAVAEANVSEDSAPVQGRGKHNIAAVDKRHIFPGTLLTVYRNSDIQPSDLAGVSSDVVVDVIQSAVTVDCEAHYSPTAGFEVQNTTTATPQRRLHGVGKGGGPQDSQYYTTVVSVEYIDICTCAASTLTTSTFTSTLSLCSCVAPNPLAPPSPPTIPMIVLTKTYFPLEGQSYTIAVTVPYIEANVTLFVDEEVVQTVIPTPLGKWNWTVPGKSASNQTVQASISAEVDVAINGIVLILGFAILIICL